MSDPHSGDTSFHARRAADGDPESLAWLVERMTPFLRLQATLRLGQALRARFEPDDLVQDVWALALPRLATLDFEGKQAAAAIVRWLTTILLHRIVDLSRAARHRRTAPLNQPTDPTPVQAPSIPTVTLTAARAERADLVWRTLQSLSQNDQEILVYRGLEQRPIEEVATLLKLSPNTLSVRYHRALARLREALPGTLADDL